ncbi:MAG: hypothetical protein IKS03_02140 [Ruminococcus sp.]|nr:hypothetical protein [Ruminococcus sp.]
MADMNEWGNNTSDSVSGVENVTSSKKGKKIAIISASVIAVAAGAGAIAYNSSDYIKNQVKLRMMKPENYYAWVNEENAQEYAAKVREQYEKSLEKIKNGQSASVAVKYDVSDDVKNYLVDNMLGVEYGEDEETDMLIDIIKNINSLEIGSGAAVKSGDVSGDMYINLNDDKLMTVDYAMADGAAEMFMRVPELTERWLSMNIENTLEETYMDDDARELMDAYKEVLKDPESVISPEELEDMIIRYTKVWNDSIGDIKLERSEETAVGDISMNYTVVSVELTNDKLVSIAENFINEAKNDEVLKRVVIDKCKAVTEDEYVSQLDEILDDIKEQSSDETAVYETYIDPKGVIRGCALKSDDAKVEAKYIMGLEGDQIRGEAYIFEDGEETFRADLTATDSGNKYTGNIDVKVEEETASVEFTDFEIVNEDNGFFSGDITINIPDVDPISLNFNSDGSTMEASTDIKIEDIEIGKFTLKLSEDFGKAPEIPSADDAYMLDPETFDSLSDYVSKEDAENFIRTICTKIGFNDDYANQAAEAFAQGAYPDER